VPALYSSGGSIRVFVDARGGLGAVRCQFLCSPGGFVKVFINARGSLSIMVYKASNRSVTVYRSRGQLSASSVFPWRVYKGIRRCQGVL
jgi:hypothetical protein